MRWFFISTIIIPLYSILILQFIYYKQLTKEKNIVIKL
jgi:hypothetical protein